MHGRDGGRKHDYGWDSDWIHAPAQGWQEGKMKVASGQWLVANWIR
jgi:hypothetical protein